jgi:hypothetical protein
LKTEVFKGTPYMEQIKLAIQKAEIQSLLKLKEKLSKLQEKYNEKIMKEILRLIQESNQ